MKGAFKLLWVDPSDVGTFATDLPWQPLACATEDAATGLPEQPDVVPLCPKASQRGAYTALLQECWDAGLDAGLTLVSLVLTFGWAGSPGEWTPWGDGVSEIHSAYVPADESTDGPFRFRSYILMDDLVLVEPALGLRPWVSRTAAERTIAQMLGPAAVNEEKKKQEGYFSVNKLIWGLEYRTEEMQVAIPEQRLLKGAYLLNEVCYDSGFTGARLRDMQVLRGTGTSWMAAMPSLALEMRSVDVFLTIRMVDPWVLAPMALATGTTTCV